MTDPGHGSQRRHDGPRAGSFVAPAESGWCADPPSTTPEVPAGPRYDVGPLIGQGGMGLVNLARDRVLDREVALKQVRPDLAHSGLAEHLLAEARITASLEHPGIVPIHDAGTGADGQPYYVMRLVHGRSLSERIAAAPTFDARVVWLRAFLAACEAVAYAHRRGVVHRDLKPANIMIGELGQVQVMDWGLAVPTGTPAGIAGTTHYMSPEQARGAPADPRADVWSLGTALVELVSGHAQGPMPRTPAELAAITRRCLHVDPAERYPDAAGLADDLARYLDGRRVAAYAYPIGTLLKRLFERWRVPIAIAGIGLVILIVTLITSGQRLVTERDRANRNLASALSGRAQSLFAEGRIPEAEVLAANALAMDPTLVDARGVLMARHARLTHVRHIPLPDRCPVPRLDADARYLLCTGGGIASLRTIDDGRVLWSIAHGASSGQILVERHRVMLLEADRFTLVAFDDGHVVARGDWDKSTFRQTRGIPVAANFGHNVMLDDHDVPRGAKVCPNVHRVFATDVDETRWLAVCDDGHVVRGETLGGPGPTIGQVSSVEHLTALAVVRDDAVWGNARGEVGMWSLTSGVTPTWQRKLSGNVSDLRLFDVVFVVIEGGRVAVLSRAGDDLASLPLGTATRGLERRANGDIVTIGRGVDVWRPPAAWSPYRADFDVGLAAATPSGDLIAAGVGDGRVELLDTHGTRITTLRPYHYVPRRPVWSDDGRRLFAAWSGRRGFIRYDAPGWAATPFERGDSLRQVVALGDRVFTMSWMSRTALFDDHGERAQQPWTGATFIDLVASPSGRWALLVGDQTPLIVRVDGHAPDLAPRWLGLGSLPLTAVVDDSGANIYVATREAILKLDAERGSESIFAPVSTRIYHLAVSERWLASAHDDGTVALYDLASGALVARLGGHHARVSTVAFTDDDGLLSASWDGTLRWWSLTPEVDPARVQARHGLTLESLLDAR